MTEIREPVDQLQPGEFEAFIDLINDAFGFGASDGFTHFLAGRYKPTPELAGCNYIIRQGNTLAAGAGVFPIDWRVGARTLRVAGVGGVAVDPRHRRQGLMRRIMDHLLAHIREAGYPLSYLGGQRQRYRYWGWERAGCHASYHVQPANVRHDPPAGYESIELDPVGDDPAQLATLGELYDRQRIRAHRPLGSMRDFLRHWRMHPLAARDAGGRVLGYIAINVQDRDAAELVVAHPDDAPAVVARAVMEHGPLAVSMPAGSDAAVTRRLASLAERVRVADSGNWQVFNWPVVIEALMHAAHATQPLMAGEVVLAIEDAGALRLAVTGEGPACEPTRARPAMTLDAATATRLLFGPLRPREVVTLPADAAALEAWCPLPLALGRLDHV
ncbi:MAG: GNAT family N-acetyltransferase [Phycisphaeraceae bacterium]